MNYKSFYILMLIGFCFFSCKKRVENISPEFIGEWWGSGGGFLFFMEIDENSNADYREVRDGSGGKAGSFSGVARANATKLTIGRIHTFKIIQYPSRIDTANSYITIGYPPNTKKANWKMELEGPKLYLGSGTYYMADY